MIRSLSEICRSVVLRPLSKKEAEAEALSPNFEQTNENEKSEVILSKLIRIEEKEKGKNEEKKKEKDGEEEEEEEEGEEKGRKNKIIYL